MKFRFVFMLIGCFMLYGTSSAQSDAYDGNTSPVYKPPDTNGEVLRREGGNINRTSIRTDNRGITRTENRSITRSITRSLTRAEVRSLMRSMTRSNSHLTSNELESPEQKVLIGGTAMDASESPSVPAVIAPIAPLQMGYTLSSQPVLRWYVSDPWNGRIEFTLNEYGKIEPVLEAVLNSPDKEGIYQVRLADYNVSLKPNTDYEWFVAITPFPEERSADLIAGAVIRYIEPTSSDFLQHLSEIPKDKRYYLYATNGYWYDAIDDLSRMIDERPTDTQLRLHRAALLEQVKLGRVVEYDRKP